MHITATRIKIQRAARFIADYDGFQDYDLIVLLNPPNTRFATRREYEQVKFNQVCDIVGEYFNIDYEIIFMKSRIQSIVNIRQIIWYFARELLKLDNTAIGRLTGFTHSTVSLGIKKIIELNEVDKKFQRQINELSELINKI